MRIIAGSLGGRMFDSPKGHRTHPMSDKIRGALFSMLGELDELTVLDAFGGSGALGFEAASRGAAAVTIIEPDRGAQAAIAGNIEQLDLAQTVKLVKATAQSWSRTQPGGRFNVILCDPPFDDLQPNVVGHLVRHLAAEGILVVSWPGSLDAPQFDGLVQLAQRSYGDAQLVFYQNIL